MMTNNIHCPVNFKPVNLRKVRLVAFFVFLLSAAYLVAPHWSIPAFLVVDFYLRAFGKGDYSPLGLLGERIVKLLSLPAKPVDGAPKEFAARVGFVVCDLLLLATVFPYESLHLFLAGMLLLFSFLESVFSICVGCYLYFFLQKFPPAKKTEPAVSAG